MITTERVEAISAALCNGRDNAQITQLLGLTPAEACAKLNAEGCDVTVEELQAYGQYILEKAKTYSANDELNEDDLDAVAGGKGEFRAGIVIGIIIGIAYFGGW